LDTSELLLKTSCWCDNIKLVYDEEKDLLSNNEGVETRVPDFGGTSAFEELDPGIPLHGSAVFRQMVEALVSAGLVRNETLRGAPYDFRYAPSSPVGAQFITDLQKLIEETAVATGQRVSLVSHSMGCLQVLYLLNKQSQEWKDRYIEKWVPIAGPFGGSATEMRLHASGDNEKLPISHVTLREEQRSYETNFWLAPVPRWFGDQVLVSTPARNYTAQQYGEFFTDIGYPAGAKMYNRIAELTSAVAAPGVDVVCLYSLGVDTPLSFNYGDKGFDEWPQVTNGDGDGTVNSFSLRLCDRWSQNGAQTRTARSVQFKGVTHSGMLSHDGVLNLLLQELGKAAQGPKVEAERIVI
jgi:lysophospholipase-3